MSYPTLQPNETRSVYFVPYSQVRLTEVPICRSFVKLVVNESSKHGIEVARVTDLINIMK